MKVTVAGWATERRLSFAHNFGVGFQARADAWYAVGSYSSFVTEIQRSSISPRGGCSPGAETRTGAEPSPKATSTNQRSASEASCHRKVGAAISRGNIDPSCG